MVTARCFCLHGLLAVVTLSSGMRMRRKKIPKTSPPAASSVTETESGEASTVVEYPSPSSCFLGSGFSIQRGCQYVQALQNIASCNSAGSGEACYTDTSTEVIRGYSREVRTSFEYSSLAETITEAEGGNYGVSVSAGFSYLRQSQVRENSVASFIGGGGRISTRSVNNSQNLKLTSFAKQLLMQNASMFLQYFSSTFVHTLTYGGSFLGSVTTDSTTGRTSMGAAWRGGNVQPDYSSPEALRNMFRSWDSTLRANPASHTLMTRRWIDLVEVQEVVFGLPYDQMALFLTESILPIVHTRISVENAALIRIDNSVRWALGTASDATLRSCLENLRNDIQRKRIGIESFDDSQVLAIQEQFKQFDLSWFESETYQSRYTACVESADKV